MPGCGFEFHADRLPADVELLGYAFTQFAFPVVAGRELGFSFDLDDGVRSPPAVLPLLARSGDGCALLAPITAAHEQIVAVRDGALVWGWHGDLDAVPAGFVAEARIYRGTTPGDVLAQWSTELHGGAPTWRDRTANPITSHLSYWTDNGAAYWYRTEPGRTISESVVDVVRHLRAGRVPIRAIELDSWFYPHATNRSIAEIGYPEQVPISGLDRWEPRDDAFPPPTSTDDERDAIERFADDLGRPPLVLHSRHVDPASRDVADGTARGEDWWVGGLAAFPADPSYFRRWFEDAARWGACCIEFDWLLVHWFGVDEVRAAPGRAAAWQHAVDRIAGDTGIDLLWCMATPGDYVVAAELERMTAVRTCDDYRYTPDPARSWTWFLTVNRLAIELGLWPFKDCFFSGTDAGDGEIDGDVDAELEAALAALSGGPVGIGDRIGRTDREIVMRTCTDDGRLLQPTRPIAMIDDCLFGAPARGERLAWATAATERDGRTWTYVLAINTAADRRTVHDRLALDEIGVDAPVAVLDWRRGVLLGELPVLDATLDARDWALFVCCPIGPEGPLVGDTSKYVTVPTG